MKTIAKRRTRSEYLDMYLNNKEVMNHESFLNTEIYLLKDAISYCVLIFQAKKQKPTNYYGFRNLENANSYIDTFKKSTKQRYDADMEYYQNRKVESDQIIEGSILYSSWGFEQTNIDFYQVMFRKGTIIVLQEIAKDRRYEQDDRGYCTPRKDTFVGEVFQTRISKNARIKINSVASAALYDGVEKYFSTYA